MSDVAITHPEKVMFPDDGITKGELAAYYELVAPAMLLHIVGRPVTLERFHRGIGDKGFFQKNVAKGAPGWLERIAVPKSDGIVNYPVVRDARGIMWLANQNCITPHVWTSRVPDLFHPDLCLFDLDPLEENADALRSAALLVRDALAELGVTSWVKTSGSKGFHVAFALDEKSDSGRVAHFAHSLGRELVRRAPDLLTQEFYKADRGGKILIDTGRNEFGATYAATYALRPKPGAPASAPCTWEEVESGEAAPRTFTLRTMAKRLDAKGDLWAKIFDVRHALPAPP
ncbi:MAG TPA: non-homologous end-joining DNA ligase [Gemmatimonadaceae bacterium]|jgi:bifunctional non-homologous end joining protein LigD|nr:non-homologous end-joining DNA ligase [Gemmatimonadaceae bacterium]